jgi:opacity protein-like surface antigen
MKNLIVGIALCLSPLCSYAETTFISEVLMGQSKHDMNSYLKSAEVETNYSSALKETSFAFRLGVKFMANFSLELSKHDHGSAVNEFTLSFPTRTAGTPDSTGGFLGPEHNVIYQVITPINIDSIRLGIKSEFYVLDKLSLNARAGLAHWEYEDFTPQALTNIGPSNNGGESGNDIYYSLGAEYKFTENFYVGLEYSVFNVAIKKKYYDDVISSYKHKVKDISFVIGWAF